MNILWQTGKIRWQICSHSPIKIEPCSCPLLLTTFLKIFLEEYKLLSCMVLCTYTLSSAFRFALTRGYATAKRPQADVLEVNQSPTKITIIIIIISLPCSSFSLTQHQLYFFKVQLTLNFVFFLNEISCFLEHFPIFFQFGLILDFLCPNEFVITLAQV